MFEVRLAKRIQPPRLCFAYNCQKLNPVAVGTSIAYVEYVYWSIHKRLASGVVYATGVWNNLASARPNESRISGLSGSVQNRFAGK
jgi:hypothetical protein